MMAFLGVLTVGFAYEWRKGALEWEWCRPIPRALEAAPRI
jgi:hypothetical protein